MARFQSELLALKENGNVYSVKNWKIVLVFSFAGNLVSSRRNGQFVNCESGTIFAAVGQWGHCQKELFYVKKIELLFFVIGFI